MAIIQGYQGVLYYGTAGSTATNQLTNIKDLSITRDVTRGNTTVRGTGSVPPIETESVTIRKIQVEFNMINDTADAYLTALRAAAAAGTAVALRGKDYSSGVGVDADFTLSEKDGMPLEGEATFDFTAVPTLSGGRTPISST